MASFLASDWLVPCSSSVDQTADYFQALKPSNTPHPHVSSIPSPLFPPYNRPFTASQFQRQPTVGGTRILSRKQTLLVTVKSDQSMDFLIAP